MPTRRRWESKGWRVVEVGYPDENSRKVAVAVVPRTRT
jgi:anti-sigma factor ChrR (cupin superfamily)